MIETLPVGAGTYAAIEAGIPDIARHENDDGCHRREVK